MENEDIENTVNTEPQEPEQTSEGEQYESFFSDELMAELDNITEGGESTSEQESADETADVYTSSSPEQGSAAIPQDENAELLEGLTSPRSKERVRNLIARQQEAEAQVQAVHQKLDQVTQMFAEANMSTQDVIEHMEFNRLATSNNPDEIRQAYQKVKEVERSLAQRLGVPTHGYDPLSEFPDLRARVDGFHMSEEDAFMQAQERKERQALEEQLRQAQGAQSQHMQAREQELQKQQFFESEVNRFNNEALRFFQGKANEPGFQEKVDYIKRKFSDPAFKQNFHLDAYGNFAGLGVSLSRLQDMYNYAPAGQRAPQPIRTKNASVGTRSRDGMNVGQRLGSILDEMGI